MKNSGIGYAIGYILAGVVGIPLLLYIINSFFFQGNDADKYIKQYLQNSEELKIKIDLDAKNNYNKEDFMAGKSNDFASGYEIYTAFLSKNGGKVYIDKIGFYAVEYEKFFSIRLTNMGDNYYLREIIDKKNVNLTVNRDDMSNPLLGSRENPIPVFKVVGDGKPLTINSSGKNGVTTHTNLDMTQKMYENSVYCHLKYVMSKEEFNERFERNK